MADKEFSDEFGLGGVPIGIPEFRDEFRPPPDAVREFDVVNSQTHSNRQYSPERSERRARPGKKTPPRARSNPTFNALPVNAERRIRRASATVVPVAGAFDFDLFSGYTIPDGYSAILRRVSVRMKLFDTADVFSSYPALGGVTTEVGLRVFVNDNVVPGYNFFFLDPLSSIPLYIVANENANVKINIFTEAGIVDTGAAGIQVKAFLEHDLIPIRGSDYRRTIVEG